MAKQSAPTREYTTHTPPPAEGRKKVRVYAAVRIEDYALMALAPVDAADPGGMQDWAPLGQATTLSANREVMYQIARNHGGLIIKADCLPVAAGMEVLHKRLVAIKTKAGVTEDAGRPAVRLDAVGSAAEVDGDNAKENEEPY